MCTLKCIIIINSKRKLEKGKFGSLPILVGWTYERTISFELYRFLYHLKILWYISSYYLVCIRYLLIPMIICNRCKVYPHRKMTILFTQIKAQHFIKETVRILNHDPSILYPQTCTLAFERFPLEANWHYYSFRQHYHTRIASSNFTMSQ